MFKLPETLTLNNVQVVKDELLTLLQEQESGSSVTLDAAALQIIDATGLQLLIAACNTFGKAGHSFKLINITPPLRQLLELSGGMEVVEAVQYQQTNEQGGA